MTPSTAPVEATEELLTVADLAREFNEPLQRIRNILGNSEVGCVKRVATVKLFNRADVVPILEDRLNRLRARRAQALKMHAVEERAIAHATQLDETAAASEVAST